MALGTLAMLFTERANAATLGEHGAGAAAAQRVLHGSHAADGRLQLDRHRRNDRGRPVGADGADVRRRRAGVDRGRHQGPDVQLLFFAIVSSVRGTQDVEAFRRRAPLPYVLRAVTVALLSLAVIFLAAFGLNITETAGSSYGSCSKRSPPSGRWGFRRA